MSVARMHSPRGLSLLKIAVVYLLIGLFLGIGMSVSHNYLLASVHTHINLLGWASLGLTGLVYCVLPALGQSRLAGAHFWLHNLGLPVMMLGLAALRLGYPVEPVVGVGAILVVAGLFAFAINLWKYRPGTVPAASADAAPVASV